MNDLDTQFYKIVGRKIRDIRTNKGLTLLDLAEQLDITTKTIQRYEMGERKIDVVKLKKITEILGTPYEDFVSEVQNERFPDTPKMSTQKKSLTQDEVDLLKHYQSLNERGKAKALENISDLTHINYYKK